MMKNRIVIMTMTLGMIIILITRILVVPVVVARNERLAVDLTVLIKSINGVAQGNVKGDICVISLFCTYHLSYYI